MSCYEAVFILGQDLTNKNVNEIIDGYAQYVTKNDGKHLGTEYWGLRNLAYPINKAKKAHYVMLAIECDGKVINDLVKKANLREDILRFMPLQVNEIKKETSVLVEEGERPTRESRAPRENKKTN